MPEQLNAGFLNFRGCVGLIGLMLDGQSFVSNVSEERLSSTGKAGGEGGCCDHLKPNLSKGKAEFRVGLGIKSMTVKPELGLRKAQKKF